MSQRVRRSVDPFPAQALGPRPYWWRQWWRPLLIGTILLNPIRRLPPLNQEPVRVMGIVTRVCHIEDFLAIVGGA